MMTFATQSLATTFLITIRLGSVLLLSPIEAIRALPIHARLLLLFLFSILMAANQDWPMVNTDEASLVISALAELCNGLMLALIFYAVFGVFQIAGLLIDAQIGLDAAAIFNPIEHNQEALTSRLLTLLGVIFFFAIDGHHKIIQGLALSFTIIPPGHLALLNGFPLIIQQCSLMFSVSFAMVSPIVASLMIIDLCGGILTRNMPQISTYFLTLPIKIMLGLFMCGILVAYIRPLMDMLFERGFQSWSVMMR